MFDNMYDRLVITSLTRNGEAVECPRDFESKYEFKYWLNKTFGVDVTDCDLDTEFGGDTDEILLYPDFGFEAHGLYCPFGIIPNVDL